MFCLLLCTLGWEWRVTLFFCALPEPTYAHMLLTLASEWTEDFSLTPLSLKKNQPWTVQFPVLDLVDNCFVISQMCDAPVPMCFSCSDNWCKNDIWQYTTYKFSGIAFTFISGEEFEQILVTFTYQQFFYVSQTPFWSGSKVQSKN